MYMIKNINNKYSQKTEFTCGPACIKIVSEFYGDNYSEKYLEEVSNCSSAMGTLHKDMVRGARKIGYTVRCKVKASIYDVEYAIKKNIPVIVDYYQWKNGHYSVIVGFDSHNIYMADPGSVKRDIGSMTRKDFLYRWYYERGEFYHDNETERAAKWIMAMVPRGKRYILGDLFRAQQQIV